jgi:predicted ATPase
MKLCSCTQTHRHRRIVLTGGPGAGKTAVLELIRQSFCPHVRVLPEAAGIVYSGGFPREQLLASRRAAQRAIFHVQHELEELAAASDAALVLCDRGTVDGAAYWPGPGSLWSDLGTWLEEQLERYHAVIHLRTPTLQGGYTQRNPLRLESAIEAAAIDQRIEQLWASHPRRYLIEATSDFMEKAGRALALVHAELPECTCRRGQPRLTALTGLTPGTARSSME